MDDMKNEEDFNRYMDNWKEQQNKMPQGQPGQTPGQEAPQGTGDFQSNAIVQSLQQQTIDPTKNAIRPSQGECPQCNTFHPPLGPGESCPMAGEAGATIGEQTPVMSDMDINKYLVNLKNLLIAHVKTKEIKDINKLFQQVTLKIAEYLEGYKE